MEKSFENELRKLMRRNVADSFLRGTVWPNVRASIKQMIEDHIMISFSIAGHYDSYISKSTTKVLYKYLRKKYPGILVNVDDNFALCSASIDKVKKAVSAFPELVNRTIAPGVYWVTLDEYGTKMIVIKQQVVGENDVSANGIKSTVNMFKTTIVFVGPDMTRWADHIRSQIDHICSRIVSRSMTSNKVRVNVLSGDDNNQASDVFVRPMEFLTFPSKAELLARVEKFLGSGSIYSDNGIAHRLGLLFEGPRGVGKTSFAYALAQHFDMECCSVDLSFFDKKNGTNAFSGNNTVYIIDEIDAQLPNSESEDGEPKAISTETEQKLRERLVKLLKAMDQMGDGSIIIATTNYPERLDTKLKRSGRFDRVEHFDNLDEEYARKMVAARDLDPDKVLKNATYPINPAYLENLIVDEIMEKNGIEQQEKVSVEELVGEVDAPLPAASTPTDDYSSDAPNAGFEPFGYGPAVYREMAEYAKSDSDTQRILSEKQRLTPSDSSHMENIQNLGDPAEDDEDEDVPGDESEPLNATIIASDEGSAVAAEDDEDEDVPGDEG